jgi:microcystin-dependent protein
MSEPYLGEISVFGFNFPPQGWALCNGQLLSISENPALFNLLGTTYGGDGINTFALPDLRGRLSMHASDSHQRGESGGCETVALAIDQMPSHVHNATAADIAGSQASPAGNDWARDSGGRTVFSMAAGANMASNALSPAGSGQAHQNMAPFLVVNFCIALQGIFPSQN